MWHYGVAICSMPSLEKCMQEVLSGLGNYYKGRQTSHALSCIVHKFSIPQKMFKKTPTPTHCYYHSNLYTSFGHLGEHTVGLKVIVSLIDWQIA